MQEKLLLIDGYSLLFRAFYGMPLSMMSPDGVHTGAVYGFFVILGKMIEEEKPDYLAVAFDRREPTFRHELFKEYKGTRSAAPPEFHEQVPLVKEILRDMEVPVVTCAGYEADDIMGTLARRAEEQDVTVRIVSGDRDLLQIASEGTEIIIPKTRNGQTTYEHYTPADVQEKYGVTPEGFIELKALMGDTSDNVPGLPGVGEKTAQKILTTFGSIENARAHITEIKPNKARLAMEEHGDLLDLSLKLVTIATDAPVAFDKESQAIGVIYTEAALANFRRLGFRSLVNKYGARSAAMASGTQGLNEKKSIAGIPGVGLVWEKGIFYAAAIAEGESVRTFAADEEKAAKEAVLHTILTNPRTATDNVKELAKWLGEETCVPLREERKLFDIILAAYLINPLKNDWDYDAIAAGYLGKDVPSRESLVGKKGIAAASAAQETLCRLAGAEAETASEAAPLLAARLAKEEMTSLFEEIELPLSFVLAAMEKEGIFTSREALASYGASLGEHIEALKSRIYEEAGEEFNLNSPKQLGQILFEKMQIPGGKKTKSGYSTAADVLEKLAPEYPVVANILEYRTYAKLKSTYADGLADYIETDGRIRTSFNQTITATGRLSSTEPNLQNIPMRMELGRLIRKCFYPAEGCVFVDADYSQIELRILAHMSGDEKLIEAYREARDIHRTTASQVFHVPFDEVTDEMRRNAKAVNFGIVYGISAFGLSQGLNISRGEANAYIAQYFATYPSIKAFLDSLVASAKENGFAVSLYGRRRPVPELRAANFAMRSFGERVAMNSPIQGTAADIMKIAMNRVYNRLRKENLRAKMILQIHDELLIEAPEEEAAKVMEILEEEMKAAADLRVTLEVDAHTGTNWYEAK